jgi:hypothetical protein
MEFFIPILQIVRYGLGKMKSHDSALNRDLMIGKVVGIKSLTRKMKITEETM